MADENDQIPGPDSLRNRSRVPDPERFRVSKGTLRIDAFMTRFIFVGGLGVIFAIFGIFFFILAEILPLFRGAEVAGEASIETGVTDPLLLGADEWSELPFVLGQDTFQFIDVSGRRDPLVVPVPLPDGAAITEVTYLQESQLVALGYSNGEYQTARIRYAPEFAEDGTRTIQSGIEWDKKARFGASEKPVANLAVSISPERKIIAAILGEGGDKTLEVDTFVQKRSLFGASGFKLDSHEDLTGILSAGPAQVLAGANAQYLVVRCVDNQVHLLKRDNGWQKIQSFNPFPESGAELASMDFIKGDVSLAFTSKDGRNAIFSLYRHADSGQRLFGQTKELDPLPGGATVFARSSRNKAFILANEDVISLRYSTTADVRWEAAVPVPFENILISGKFDRILALDKAGTIHAYTLKDPHPEAGFKAFFSRIWYEGQDSPQYLWQSTGGSDDFEPKLSLIPLIVGSFKGTFYALLFAVPIALLAAIYTSQFLNPQLKRVIKPGIEIMASLPSVVLGFLGALWLAPILEDRIPSVILICLAIPGSAVLIGYLWNLLPIRIRILIPKGWEFVIFVPLIVVVSWVAWASGPLLESIAFRVQDPATGESVADFRLWWEAFAGSQFQQRNSLVVGFMMGFAVIPIIYTIAEDALSAVPISMTSASLALGASRWQTTARIVLPTASAGIFSACMIGLGRAVGETMIVVMATGNTPILDFDIFSGMRTLSANIAVELPEAPHGGTLYRTLFLGAFVLFVLTFFVNTIAEMMRHRLRDRYKVVS